MEKSMTPDAETEVRTRYAALKAHSPEGMPLTVLHVGPEQTGIASGSAPDPEAVLTLGIGAQKTARDFFKHAPPWPNELEDAIALVEDALAPARDRLAGDSTLFSADAALREIALLASIPESPELTLPIDAMERVFGRLAAVSLGRPCGLDRLPESPEFAATVLILREFMHHMRFSAITINA
jgi:exopolyphosphatase/pppGpp-phosphohydrolase